MDLVGEIERLIGPTVELMGFRLVRVKLLGHPRRTLQVMAERGDGTPVTVDDCADLSGAISALLDVEDPVRGAYHLEVSSTGIDRPLVRSEDFERFAGFEAKSEVDPPIDGRRRFRGRLVGLEDGTVRVETKEGVSSLPLATISDAKLVLTDELIAWTERARAMAGKDEK